MFGDGLGVFLRSPFISLVNPHSVESFDNDFMRDAVYQGPCSVSAFFPELVQLKGYDMSSVCVCVCVWTGRLELLALPSCFAVDVLRIYGVQWKAAVSKQRSLNKKRLMNFQLEIKPLAGLRKVKEKLLCKQRIRDPSCVLYLGVLNWLDQYLIQKCIIWLCIVWSIFESHESLGAIRSSLSLTKDPQFV